MTARPRLDDDERRRRLGQRHRLVPEDRTDDVVAVTESLVALHSSDPTTVFLSAALRMPDPAIAPLESALYQQRTILRHHAMRRTIWVMTPTTARLAHIGATLKLARQERARLVKAAQASGLPNAEMWVADMATAVAAALTHGPITARSLGADHPELTEPLVLGGGSNYPSTQPAHTRFLQLLGFEGRAVRTHPTSGWTNSQYHWTLSSAWSPGVFDTADGTDVAAAQAQLADTWLRSFGPAMETDLQWWMGWTKGDTARALSNCLAEEVVLDSGLPAWVAEGDAEPTPENDHWVALLPGLDPSVMGWKFRAWYLPDAYVPRLFDRNGNAGSCVLVDGEVVGGWAQRADGHIAVSLFVDVGREVAEEIADAAHRLQNLLGDVRFRPRFPAPIQRELFSP